MGIAAAAFHWAPDTFWAATAHEFWAAYEAWEELLPILTAGAVTRG